MIKFNLNKKSKLGGLIAGLLLYCSGLQAAGYFTLAMDTVNGTVGQTVNVPVTVQNFVEMISAQGTINFDTSELQFVQVSGLGLSSLSNGNFGLNGAPSGYITFSWTDPTLNGTNLADDSVFFAIKFQVKANACKSTAISFGNTPTILEFVDTSFNTLANFNAFPGAVIPSGASVIPTIAVQGSANICSGSQASFNAVISNGGSNPVYQWRVNGINTGPDSSVFTSSSFTNGQVISCLLTSSSTCASPDTALSNNIALVVSSNEVPSVQVTSSDTIICSGATVTFIAHPVSGGGNPVYQWFKNGNIVGADSAGYTDGGLNNNDSVWVVLTSSAACASPPSAKANAVTLTVNPVPAAPVAGSNSPVVSGDTIALTATLVAGATYQWNGPNGFSSAQQNPQILHATSAMSGTYQVVVVNGSGCSSVPSSVNLLVYFTGHFTLYMDTVQATAGQQVVVNIRARKFDEMLSAQGTISFDTTQLSFVQVSHFGLASLNSSNFGISNLASGEITFSWFDATLQGTSLSNDSDFFSLQFNVSPAACSITALTFSSIPTPLEFVDTSYTALDSFSLLPGRVNVTGGIAVPAITIAGIDTVCAGQPASYTANAVNGGLSPSFQWKVNGVNAGSNSNTFTSSSLNNGAVVSCALTSSLICASPATANSNSITVTVGSALVPRVTINASADTVCPGTPVTFNALPVNGGASPVYLWKKNGSTVGGNHATYTDSTLHNRDSVWVLMASGLPCASPTLATGNTIILTVDTSPVPSVSISASENSICADAPVVFTAVVTNGGPNPVFQWRDNGNNVGVNSNTYTSNTLTANDSVSVILQSSAHCASPVTGTSGKLAVTVIALPATPVISQNKDTLTSSAAVGNQWYFNGAAITGATGQTYIAHATGNYQDIVTGTGNCSSDTSNDISYIYVSVQNIASADIEVYPNPVNDLLFIRCGNSIISAVKLIDVLGQVITSKQVNQNNIRLNVSGIASGNYFLLIETMGSVITKRIIISAR